MLKVATQQILILQVNKNLQIMDKAKKEKRYFRIYEQLKQILSASSFEDAKMATILAVLHHKMEYFFWTGFYVLHKGELTVKTYQGPLACQVLEKDKGVCWAAIKSNKTIIVEDVHRFEGHIACDSRSKSEIAVPLQNSFGKPTGVLDVDSAEYNSFDEVDAHWLEMIVKLI